MLLKIFSQHPKSLRIGSESRVAESYDLLVKRYEQFSTPKEQIDFIENTVFFGAKFKKNKYQYKNNTVNPLKDIINREDLSGKFNLDYMALIDKTIEQKNINYVVEKTPSNVFHAKELSLLYPDFKLIVIHRDVRDVVASLKKRYLNLLNNPEIFNHNIEIKKLDKDYNLIIDALFWSKLVKKSYESQAEYGKDKIKIIKYEELVSNPDNIIKSICSWLNEEFYPEMLNLKGRNSANQNTRKYIGINDSSVGNYKNILDDNEIAIIEKYAKKGMSILNLTKSNRKSNYLKSLQYEIESYFKIFNRIRKRVLLMNFKYTLNFSKRFLKKLIG